MKPFKLKYLFVKTWHMERLTYLFAFLNTYRRTKMYNNLSNDKGSWAEYVSDDNTQGQLHRTDLGPGYIVLTKKNW